ncbi:phage tail sheath family protein [Phormidesmis sp. 146-35]
MAFNIGLNVLEVDGRAAPTIVAAPTSVTGFLVRSQRGVPNLPIVVRGFTDFVTNFGSYTVDSSGNPLYGAHTIRGFFDNGGSTAYVVRIVGSGSGAANRVLNDRASTPQATLRIAAGIRGREDPGSWGNDLSVTISDHARGAAAIPAQIIGSTAEPFALIAGQQLEITVNGATPAITITFNTTDFVNIATASAAEVAAAIRRQTAAVKVVVTPNRQLIVASPSAGVLSRLEITGAAATPLGFTATTANSNAALPTNTTLAVVQNTGGFLPGSAIQLETRGHVIASNAILPSLTDGASINVSVNGGTAAPIRFTASDFVGGVGAVTSSEVVAAINRQAQGFTAALNLSNRLVLISNTYGATSTLAVTAGATDATTALGLAGNTPVAGIRQYRTVDSVAESSKLITWTGGLTLPANFARIQSVEFDVFVNYRGLTVEQFESLSMQPALDYSVDSVINDPDRGSRYITVTNQNSASAAGLNAPLTGTFSLAGGNNGNAPVDTNYIGDPAQRTGLYAFNPLAIQLLACPETTAIGVTTACLSYCESRGDAMFVGTAPRGFNLDGIKAHASNFRGRKVYGALYAPWIAIANPLDTTGNNPLLWIPPVGHILGSYARISDTRGIWKAPAGDEARLSNALAVEFDMTDTDHTDLVKSGGVNGIRAIPGSGIIIDASRTLSTDTRWLFVNVRRLFNFVKSSLREGLRFVQQEPHSEELRRSVKFNVITPFLLGLWRQGAFGSDPPDQVFTVKCDAENNPPTEVNLGNFKVEVYFYPVKPAETIIIVVGQQESGATASEP